MISEKTFRLFRIWLLQRNIKLDALLYHEIINYWEEFKDAGDRVCH